jgi:uncharacterized protein
MTKHATIPVPALPLDPALREAILEDPAALVGDDEVLRALVAAGGRAMGANVVDLRGLAMEQLEGRLGRLEEAHRTVIAAAYDNLAGTHQIQRAVLHLLEAPRFDSFLADLEGDVASVLRVESLRLVIESVHAAEAESVVGGRFSRVLLVQHPGFVDAYLGRAPRSVVLRPVTGGGTAHASTTGRPVRSEAALRLDLGPGRRPGMLLLGSEDPHLFAPQQGTDLLQFLGGVLERVLRRWLA